MRTLVGRVSINSIFFRLFFFSQSILILGKRSEYNSIDRKV